MASLVPAAVQNENSHQYRGKVLEGAKAGVVQNENIHVRKGKGVEVSKAEVPKPVKNSRQQRKALADLSQAKKPFTSTTTKEKSAATTLKEKSAATTVKEKSTASRSENVKKAFSDIILTDEEIKKCQEWAKEGIVHMHFTGNDMLKFEADQQEERVNENVSKAMAGLRAWTDFTFGLDFPVNSKQVLSDSDDEDVFKKLVDSGDEDVYQIPWSRGSPRKFEPVDKYMGNPFDIDYESLYFELPEFDLKIKEESDCDD